MNAKERNVIKRMIEDMRHNSKQVKQYIAEKGGLATDAYIERVEMQARDLEYLVDGTYFGRYSD